MNWVADFLTRNPEQASWAVEKRAKHSLHLKRPDGLIEANFTGAPCHYLDGGLWKPIDTKLQLIGTEYGAPGLRGRVSKNGIVNIANTGYSHRSTRIGIFDPTTKAFTAVKTIPLGLVSDDKIIAESGIWKRVLTLTESGVREEIIIQSKPTSTGAGLNDWLVLETQVTGMSFADGELDSFELEEFRFPPPSTHDSNMDVAPCKRFARTIGGVQYIYTGVPVSWLADATYPVTIDPDYSETICYEIDGGATDYATTRSTSTQVLEATTNVPIGQYFATPNYGLFRGFSKYNTSDIPDTDIVTQANLKLTCIGDSSTTDFDLQIVEQNWSAQDPIGAANREAAYDACLAATNYILWRNTSGMSINTQYTSSNLTTSYISKTGSTYFSFRSSRDKGNNEPSDYEYINIATHSHATAAYRPVLTVLYSPAPTGNFFAFF